MKKRELRYLSVVVGFIAAGLFSPYMASSDYLLDLYPTIIGENS